MSIKVELNDLADELSKRGPGYLLTSGEDGRPHATQVMFVVDGAALRAPTGRKSSSNVDRVSVVSMLWPPTEPGGYSLIVDGDALIEGPDDDRWARITPTHAILHRPAESPGPNC